MCSKWENNIKGGPPTDRLTGGSFCWAEVVPVCPPSADNRSPIAKRVQLVRLIDEQLTPVDSWLPSPNLRTVVFCAWHIWIRNKKEISHNSSSSCCFYVQLKHCHCHVWLFLFDFEVLFCLLLVPRGPLRVFIESVFHVSCQSVMSSRFPAHSHS